MPPESVAVPEKLLFKMLRLPLTVRVEVWANAAVQKSRMKVRLGSSRFIYFCPLSRNAQKCVEKDRFASRRVPACVRFCTSKNAKVLWRGRQNFTAGLRDQYRIFNPNSSEPLQIYTRLDGDCHSRL